MSYRAERVTVLGCAVGNLWDIYLNDVRVCRATYHGNTLHITQQKCNGLDAVAIVYAIEALYEENAQ